MPQLIGVPSRQSQYHKTALVNRDTNHPMIPAKKVNINIIIQKSIGRSKVLRFYSVSKGPADHN